MLNWLIRQLSSFGRTIERDIREFVSYLVYAVSAFFDTVISDISRGWNDMTASVEYIWNGITSFAQGIWHALVKIIYVIIPAVLKWIWGQLAAVWDYAVAVFKYLYSAVQYAIQYALYLVNIVVKWVYDNIYSPLAAWVNFLYQYLLKWAYTAWWWINNPWRLADLLFWYIVSSFMRQAWTVATYIGEFVVRLFMANVVKSIDLVESILTNVL